jgi:preprotein translocase subunit YajC
MNYEFMGVMTFIIFISSLIAMFGFMVYDQKKQQEKHKKKS